MLSVTLDVEDRTIIAANVLEAYAHGSLGLNNAYVIAGQLVGDIGYQDLTDKAWESRDFERWESNVRLFAYLCWRWCALTLCMYQFSQRRKNFEQASEFGFERDGSKNEALQLLTGLLLTADGDCQQRPWNTPC